MQTALNRVLIPIDVSGTVSLGGPLIETLPLAEAVLLGYWPIPEQTTASQARNQFGTEAKQRLEAVADRFSDRDVEVRTQLVFTRDRRELIDRATNQYACQSVLIPGTEPPPSGTTRGIVLVKPDADLERMVTTLGTLFGETGVELRLFHAVEDQDERLSDSTEYMLRGMVDHLAALGIDRERLTWDQSTDRDRLDVILSEAAEYDFIVLSETQPNLRERVFGTVQSQLATTTGKPLLTVRARD
ncbi:hypothetical protein [Halorubrum vacuolatum]|uniref:Universal stress protein family protein n=1 Tax=Halorubrum vacuolatum TaxID=63740 RepID=A0A238WGM9_HALVU|nr:hypothetical protein [Halorubrum vacuolatum]SNR44829.1 hypothetical protein SAMN06264855_10769 [Halorubrum vacuolatum]